MVEHDIRVDPDALEKALADVATAWKDAEAGRPVAPSNRLYFVDWAALCAVLTPRRYEMLRRLRAVPATGIRALARELGRDVKHVHEDVTALEELGLIERDPETGSLTVSIDEISSTIRFAA